MTFVWRLTLQWTESTDEHVRSYVNGIPTGSGGTHENGFRSGLNKAVRNYIDTHNLTPRGVKITHEDIREGLVAIVSIFIAEPQFQGQTKDRLNNPEVQAVVEATVRPAIEQWMNNNRSVADSGRGPDHRRGPGPRRVARRVRSGFAQRWLQADDAAGKTQRLCGQRQGRLGDLYRRR